MFKEFFGAMVLRSVGNPARLQSLREGFEGQGSGFAWGVLG